MRRKSTLKPLGVYKQRELLRLLDDALQHAKMEHADFGVFWVQGKNPIPFPVNDKQVNEFIKERTKTYRESWIESPLKRAIELIQDGGKSE